MKPSQMLARLEERFGHAVIAYVDADGYPMSVATDFEVDEARGIVALRAVAGDAQPPQGSGSTWSSATSAPSRASATTSAATSRSGGR